MADSRLCIRRDERHADVVGVARFATFGFGYSVQGRSTVVICSHISAKCVIYTNAVGRPTLDIVRVNCRAVSYCSTREPLQPGSMICSYVLDIRLRICEVLAAALFSD